MRFFRMLGFAGLTFLFTVHPSVSQPEPAGTRVNGFAVKISGETMPYWSLYLTSKPALITRALNGLQLIKWETDPVPEVIQDNNVCFQWMCAFSSGTARNSFYFDLYLNNSKVLTFLGGIHRNQNWTVTGNNGVQLSYRHRWTDQVNDEHGFMFLTVPANLLQKNKPAVIGVVGERAGASEWYMTFQYPLKNRIECTPSNLVVRGQDGDHQQVQLLIDYFSADKSSAEIIADNGIRENLSLEIGPNIRYVNMKVAESPAPVKISIRLSDGTSLDKIITLKPVRKKEIWLIPHSHNDIGYTALQPEVLKLQVANIREALRLIDRTRNYPEGARYKWNLEVLWSVEEFMRTATDVEKKKFIAAVQSGSLGLNATFTNQLTGLCRPEEMMRITGYAKKLYQSYGFRIESAMISDVPGINWSYMPALAESGVKYFSDGPNPGDRIGTSTQAWGDRPFWWVTPSGTGKILYWKAGKGYAFFHGQHTVAAFSRFPALISGYLAELEEQHDPYDMVQLRFTVPADNGTNDSTLSDFVKAWNEKYVSPKLVIATTDEMFKAFASRYADVIPSFTGDFTPYWEDGALSTAFELGLTRNASEKLVQAENLNAMMDPSKYSANDFYEAWKDVHLFDEHTWGAHMSISYPDSSFTTGQWNIKRSFAVRADSLSGILLKQVFPDENGAGWVEVINTGSWPRSGLVILSSNQSGEGDRVRDPAGKIIPSQRLSTGELAIMAENVPALGSVIYSLSQGSPDKGTSNLLAETDHLSNTYYDLEINPETGAVKSLWSKIYNRQLADSASGFGLDEYFYVPGKDPLQAIRDNHVTVSVREKGPLVAELEMVSQPAGTTRLIRRIRLVDGCDEIIVENKIWKTKVRDKESVHIGFPFSVPDGRMRVDLGWGIMEPEAGQLPGSCKDFLSVNRWLDISNQEYGVTWVNDEAPLVEVGKMTDETHHDEGSTGWLDHLKPSSRIFSFIMNNYWHTNYKADQEGEADFHYAIRAHGMFDALQAYRFGTGINQPLLARKIGSGRKPIQPLLSLDAANTVITSMKPSDDGKALILRLYNAGGSPEEVALNWIGNQPAAIYRSSFLEDKGEVVAGHFNIPAFGIITLRCE